MQPADHGLTPSFEELRTDITNTSCLSTPQLCYSLSDFVKRGTFVSGAKDKTQCGASLCIQELTADNYFEVTQQTGKTVVVLHYNSNCVACSSVGHVFLAAAHTLRRLHDVTFARINTAGNTLPWHLHFTALPSIIVHPPLRKSESRVFDLSHPITPASVLSFIMADLGPRQRITLALQACGEPCREGVLHEAALTSTTLHHNITLSTSRLQRLLDRLVKAGPATHAAADFSLREQRQYERLWHARSRLVKDIKTQRKKLEHLNHMQKLLSKPLDQAALDSMRVESFNYLMEKLSATPSSSSSPSPSPSLYPSKEPSIQDTTHDEL
ncbi:Thioredoxin domain-containing protein 11 [Chionoecetes opilio]|uniref:Thioredoxin domain-containing protein 11 n=1 Tax=Chionoecetes opilio TaxID=41210 RepID=A0A8J4Z4X8_CHIOP|nr:Thioredoxin domain-containing protein 11 [Chionoecetes opilio]